LEEHPDQMEQGAPSKTNLSGPKKGGGLREIFKGGGGFFEGLGVLANANGRG